jgi:UDP-N-acetylglucosamine--N-acetylmuramyl-(pentapeptide) pyrophosphoryl-undecaprenol N-acetylglucosamine transferase
LNTPQYSNKKRIILTGGGTAGHVIPQLAIIPKLKAHKWQILYIGTNSIEKNLIENESIEFATISAGKLRRYFSFKNITDIFKTLLGIITSLKIIYIYKPHIVFSKGGFVSFPVSFAAFLLKVPVITHESDLSPGLANKMIALISTKILYSFPETKKYLPTKKSHLTGIPIRAELKDGNIAKGINISGLNPKKNQPIILIMGGSQGATSINNFIVNNIELLTKSYQLIHITGKNKKTSIACDNYWQTEFAYEELKHLLAISQCTICRAGANTIFELLALKQPMVLIPLVAGSRGDQILNAKSFLKSKYANVINEKDLNFELVDNNIRNSMSFYLDKKVDNREASELIIDIINSHYK